MGTSWTDDFFFARIKKILFELGDSHVRTIRKIHVDRGVIISPVIQLGFRHQGEKENKKTGTG